MNNDFSDTYRISESIGQGQSVTDDEFFAFVFGESDELELGRQSVLRRMFADGPWHEELEKASKVYAEAQERSRINPKAVKDEAWEQMLVGTRINAQADAMSLAASLRTLYTRIVRSKVEGLKELGPYQMFHHARLLLNWQRATPALNNPRSGVRDPMVVVQGHGEVKPVSSVYQLQVPELESLGWNSLVERRTEMTALGACHLTYSFARKTKQSAALTFALLFSDGTYVEGKAVESGILVFDVPCESVSSLPDEILVLAGTPTGSE